MSCKYFFNCLDCTRAKCIWSALSARFPGACFGSWSQVARDAFFTTVEKIDCPGFTTTSTTSTMAPVTRKSSGNSWIAIPVLTIIFLGIGVVIWFVIQRKNSRNRVRSTNIPRLRASGPYQPTTAPRTERAESGFAVFKSIFARNHPETRVTRTRDVTVPDRTIRSRDVIVPDRDIEVVDLTGNWMEMVEIPLDVDIPPPIQPNVDILVDDEIDIPADKGSESNDLDVTGNSVQTNFICTVPKLPTE